MSSPSLREILEAENPPETPARKQKVNGAPRDEDSIFSRVREVDTVAVLDWLGIEHDGRHATCPGCQEDGALICKDGGLKCLHNRCSHVGPAGHPGFRSNVDIVTAVQGGEPLEAAKAACERFGIEIPTAKKANGSNLGISSVDSSLDDWIDNADEGDVSPISEQGVIGSHPEKPAVRKIPLVSLDVALLEPDEPILWLWADRHLVAPGRPTIVGAYGGIGKTWLVLTMALSVATGIPFLGTPPARTGRVVVLEYETGSRRLRRRLRRLVHGYGIGSGTENLQFCAQEDLAVFLTSPEAESELVEICTGAELLVIDSLLQGSPGLRENEAEMAGPLHLLGRISSQTGCAVVIIHHERKTSDANANSGAGQSLRGHSALQAACDAIWRLNSSGDRIEMRATKASDGPSPQGWDLEIVDTVGGGIVIEATDAPEAGVSMSESTGLDARVLDAVTATPGASGRTVRVAVGGRREAVSDALARLALQGVVESRAGKNNSTNWWPVKGGR